MPTTNGNRKLLDLKRWEFVSIAPQATAAAHFIVSSRHYRQQQLLLSSNTAAHLYNPSEDGFVAVPSPALAGTFGAGACGVAASFSTGITTAALFLTATAGTTTSINTNQNLQRDLRGYSVYFVGGNNAGKLKTIASNTIGANAVITFAGAPEAVAFNNSSQYRLMTPVWFVLGAGTLAAGSFRKYDLATNTWTTLAHANLPSTIGTDAKLVSTPAWIDTGFKSFSTGTATSGTSTTLVDSSRSWLAGGNGQWANAQIRITGGTGAGQIRAITSSDNNTITVAGFATTPDSTSTYSIEGNDDRIYFLGNNAVGLHIYNISTNSWTAAVVPAVARGGAPGAGMSAHWVHSAPAADWNNENTIKNGRYIYSFRGNGGAQLDRFDIAGVTWEAISYSPAAETFNAGTKYAYNKDRLYISKENTGRWFAFDFAESAMQAWGVMTYTQGAALVGDTAFDVTYRDGATEIDYLYMLLNTSNVLLRQQVV
jgi:hypothetical protein